MISIDINVFKGNEEEQWKPVAGFTGYEVSDQGRVRSFKSGKAKILKQIKCKGYSYVNLYKKGKKHFKSVHRLVAEAFLGIPEVKLEVNHKNGLKTDNRLSNLEWVTPLENMIHAVETGLIDQKGEKNTQAKLSNEEVLQIRDMLDAGLPQKEIAEIFNIRQSTVSRIKTGRRWTHLTTRTPEKPRLKNLGKTTPITINLNINFEWEVI
jgi:hypothetical protein